MIKANFHTHTKFCDGCNTPEEMVEEAIRLHFTSLGFSGHMDTDIHMDFPAYAAEIRRLQTEYKDTIDILLGTELDTLYDPAIAADVEYVIGSTHYLPVTSDGTGRPLSPEQVVTPILSMKNAIGLDSSPADVIRLCKEYFGGDYYALTKAYYELEATVADRFPCTFIGHFDLVTRFNDQCCFFDEEDPRYLRPALEAMEYLVSKDIPFEINCGAVNRGRKKELYPRTSLLKALHEFGGRIIISSDAHSKELLSGCFDLAAERALAAGFTRSGILKHDRNGAVIWEEVPLIP